MKRGSESEISAVNCDANEILKSTVRLSQHVVYRSLAQETVLLNLTTVRYHGLNRTAGHMLEVLQRSRTVHDAVDTLAREYSCSRGEIEEDVTGLCADLLGRGLMEVIDGG